VFRFRRIAIWEDRGQQETSGDTPKIEQERRVRGILSRALVPR